MYICIYVYMYICIYVYMFMKLNLYMYKYILHWSYIYTDICIKNMEPERAACYEILFGDMPQVFFLVFVCR